MGKNILLIGAISLANKGTAGIVIQTIESLQTLFGDARINVELFFPERQRKIIDIETSTVKVVSHPLHNIFQVTLSLLFALINCFFYRFTARSYLKTSIISRFLEADIVIDISAEAFTNYFGEKLLMTIYRYMLHLPSVLLSIWLHRPLIFYAQTLAPFGHFRVIMKYVLSKAALITVRDQISFFNLQKEGLDMTKVYVTADPAFLLKAASKSRILDILSFEGIFRDEFGLPRKPLIGVVLARNIGRIMQRHEYLHLVNVFSSMVNQLSQQKNDVFFIPHHSGKINKISDDVMVGRDIQKRIEHNPNFLLIRGDYSPQELKGIIALCDVLVSIRMHPVIAATSMNIPCVIIAFNEKAYGLMKQLQQEQFICDIRAISSDELTQKINLALSEKEKISKELIPTIKKMKRLAMKNAELVKEIFK
jgi:polysaccharide pyruvyl transferase WcaK-like protein